MSNNYSSIDSSIAERQDESVPFFEVSVRKQDDTYDDIYMLRFCRSFLLFLQSKAWKLLNYTILSTSNCGNPSLRLFGFGPVVPDGFGIGYIIKDSSIHYSISSKHRQTSRYASVLEASLREMASLFRSKEDKPYSMKKGSSKRGNSFAFKCKSMFSNGEGANTSQDEAKDESNDAYGDLWGITSPRHMLPVKKDGIK